MTTPPSRPPVPPEFEDWLVRTGRIAISPKLEHSVFRALFPTPADWQGHVAALAHVGLSPR